MSRSSVATHAGGVLDFLEIDAVDGVIRSLFFEELRRSRAAGLQFTTTTTTLHSLSD